MISLLEKLKLNSQSRLANKNLIDIIMAFINVWKDNKFIKEIQDAIKSWINNFNIKDIQKYVYAINCEDHIYAEIRDNINDQYANKNDLKLMWSYVNVKRKGKFYNKDVVKIYDNLTCNYCIGDDEVLFRNDGDFDEDIYVIGNNEGLLITVMGDNILFLTNND